MDEAEGKNNVKQKQLLFMDQNTAWHPAVKPKPALGDEMANQVPQLPIIPHTESMRGQTSFLK
jgi:hypothetical protein